MAIFGERAAHSVAHMFLCISTICGFSYFPFCFEGSIWGLIAPVPAHCILDFF